MAGEMHVLALHGNMAMQMSLLLAYLISHLAY